jgi:uncharacterized membrane protein YagU involved in acid resistance
VTYGAAWWFLGALTLLPLLLGRAVSWEVTAAQDELPSLFGHLLYGATLAAGVVLLRGRATGPEAGPRRRGGLGSGAGAGLGAAVLLGAGLRSQDGLASATRMVSDGRPGLAWPTVLVFGLTAGLLYAALFPAPRRGSGPALVRGAVFGFLCWTFGAQTLLPLLSGEGLGWSVAEARAGFSALPAYLLFGTALGLGFAALTAVVDGLLSDRARTHDREGPASRSLRAVGQGAVAGLAGGALFTVVMVVTGYLPTVARLVGSDSQVTGVAVHLVISFLIGASYGLLFRRQSYDDGSALGWGVAYGFVWWFLGALTLLPILLGGRRSGAQPPWRRPSRR